MWFICGIVLEIAKNGWRTNKKSLEHLLTLWEIHTGTPGSESRLRILRMPSACVTVIITSHYLIKDGTGIWCHCHVTDCWVITPRQSRNLQQTQYLLELTHFVYRWSIWLYVHTLTTVPVYFNTQPHLRSMNAVMLSLIKDDSNFLSVNLKSLFLFCQKNPTFYTCELGCKYWI